MKVFVLSPNKEAVFTPALVGKLEAAGSVVFDTLPRPLEEVPGLLTGDEERILALDPDYCNWKFTAEDIAKVPHLKAIILQTTGFGWIDTAFATAQNIPVLHLKGFFTEAVAEWVQMMTIAVARKLPLVIKDSWKQDFIKHQGVELKGKKAGIIGLGTIGTRIAELATGMGMEVVYWSKNSRNDHYRYLELEELVRTADVIFPVVAQNDDTAGLLTDELLRTIKPSAMFISIIHKIYNHELLLEMVKQKHLYGYAFEEGTGAFASYEGNVFASPELAWATDGSMQRNGELWAEAIIDAVNGIYSARVN